MERDQECSMCGGSGYYDDSAMDRTCTGPHFVPCSCSSCSSGSSDSSGSSSSGGSLKDSIFVFAILFLLIGAIVLFFVYFECIAGLIAVVVLVGSVVITVVGFIGLSVLCLVDWIKEMIRRDKK